MQFDYSKSNFSTTLEELAVTALQRAHHVQRLYDLGLHGTDATVQGAPLQSDKSAAKYSSRFGSAANYVM